MINVKKFMKTELSALDTEIARLFEKLKVQDPNTEEYDKTSEQLAKLYKLKEIDSKSRVSSDLLVGAASNLIGILMILGYEHGHVIGSKAISFVGRKISI